MRYISEYRNGAAIQKLVKEIHRQAEKLAGQINLMEVCGTHTMTIGRYGIRKLLPASIHLLSGPGCPVCVTPNRYLDTAIEFSRLPNTIVATFGDMMKVPGSYSSLEKQQAENNNIRVVYSPFECLSLAERNRDKNIIFLGVGFETTVPVAAMVLKEAQRCGIKNFFSLSGHKLILPAMEYLLKSGQVNIDGFICPGHVSAITGSRLYKEIPDKYGISCVVSGFEPIDILQSILLLTNILVDRKKPCVKNQYKRVVKENGNKKALALISDVFEATDSEWRGLGIIRTSGLSIRKDYAKFDASKQFSVKVKRHKEEKNCICGDILKGIKTPQQCRLFGKRCLPEEPVGPCMVSSEGACAAFYRYERT